MTKHPDLDEGTQLMLAFQQGSEKAFDELVVKYQNAAFGMLRRLLGPHAMVEDLAQEAFIRVYRAKQRYQPAGKFTTFLYRITYNLALNRLRDDKRQGVRSLPEGEDGGPLPLEDLQEPPPWARPNQDLWADRIGKSLMCLPQNQRTALVLQHYDDLDLTEIGEILEVSPKAVKSLLHRARENLRELLQPYKDAETD